MYFSEYEFEVLVITSRVQYAGTDAKVFIKLFGAQHESDEIELEDKSLNKFEYGRYEWFTLFGFKVGKVKKIEHIAEHIKHSSEAYVRKRMKPKPNELRYQVVE